MDARRKKIEIAKVFEELKEDREYLSGIRPEVLSRDDIENSLERLANVEADMYSRLGLGTKRDKVLLENLRRTEGTQMREELEEEGELTRDQLEEFRQRILRTIDTLIKKFPFSPEAKDLANIMGTEKEFLSEKVPKDVAENIASFVTGKKGAIGSQMSQLRTDMGKPGVPSKGGRKTKRKQQKRRKTHGRRV
jgi:hypothetical protein